MTNGPPDTSEAGRAPGRDARDELEALRRRVAELEAALHESESKFRSLTDSAPVGLFLDDAQGNAIFINRKCAELVGVPPDDALSLNWIPYLHPDDRDRVVEQWQKAFTTSSEFALEYRYVHADGKVVWVLGEVVPILNEDGEATLFIGSLTDISARKQIEEARAGLEAQLLQAQKMESVGRLAGGIAHDFNNLLMGVVGHVDLCRRAIDTDSPAQAWLDQISERAEKSATIVSQLLAFARKQAVQPRPVDLNRQVDRSLDMLRNVLGQQIRIAFTPSSEAAMIAIDPVQVDQVVINLCVNARNAIRSSGRIDIDVRLIVESDGDDAHSLPEGMQAPCVLLRVRDTGRGIEPDVLQHIFDPFFTTMPEGEGTGLGLASVYGIVRQNGGRIDVSSVPGKGTSFCLYFPLADAAQVDTAAVPDDREDGTPGGSETILLVEDEASIRNTLTIFLERCNYTVLAAPDPETALRVARTHAGEIHVLVSDVLMPGMAGDELAVEIEQHRPGIKIVLMSGYSREVVPMDDELRGTTAFLSKPFRFADMDRAIRALLDADRTR